MKSLYVLLIFLLVPLYHAEDILYCEDMKDPVGIKDCNYLPLRKGYGYYKCCYIRRKIYSDGNFANYTACEPFSRDAYEHLPKVVKSLRDYIKSQGGIIENFEFDCPSNYLYLSLLSFMIFLL